jgi:hypothetical protein
MDGGGDTTEHITKVINARAGEKIYNALVLGELRRVEDLK